MTIPKHVRHDLVGALRDADALEQFEALPLEEQERFWSWIAKSQDRSAYWRRIDILVMGMRMAPRITGQVAPGFWTETRSL